MKRIFAILLASLTAGMFMGYDSARAANPSFIGWKVAKITTEGQAFRISIRYTNNSNNKIVTAFFQKTVSVSSQFVERKMHSYDHTYVLKGHTTSSKVNKVELYPGQSYQVYYLVPFDSTTCVDTYGGVVRNERKCPQFEYFRKQAGNIAGKLRVSHTFNASSKAL